MNPYYQDDQVTLYHGDCLDVLGTLDANSMVHDCVLPEGHRGPHECFQGHEWANEVTHA